MEFQSNSPSCRHSRKSDEHVKHHCASQLRCAVITEYLVLAIRNCLFAVSICPQQRFKTDRMLKIHHFLTLRTVDFGSTFTINSSIIPETILLMLSQYRLHCDLSVQHPTSPRPPQMLFCFWIVRIAVISLKCICMIYARLFSIKFLCSFSTLSVTCYCNRRVHTELTATPKFHGNQSSSRLTSANKADSLSSAGHRNVTDEK